MVEQKFACLVHVSQRKTSNSPLKRNETGKTQNTVSNTAVFSLH